MSHQKLLYIIITVLIIAQAVTWISFARYKASTPRGILEKYSAEFKAIGSQNNMALTADATRGTGRATRCFLYMSAVFDAVADGDEARAEQIAEYIVMQCT